MRLTICILMLYGIGVSCSNKKKEENILPQKRTFEDFNNGFFKTKFDNVFISNSDSKSVDSLPLKKTIKIIKKAKGETVKFFPPKYIVFCLNGKRIDSLGYDGKYIKYKGGTFNCGSIR